MRSKALLPCVVAAVVGALGGALAARALSGPLAGPWSGAAAGVAFAALARSRATSPGAGLTWGLGFGLVLWLAVPVGLGAGLASDMSAGMLEAARARFPDLVAALVLLGAPIGLALGALEALRSRGAAARFSWPRALVVGGLAGIAGGVAFGRWMAQAGFFPLVAGLVGSESAGVGMTLHFVFAVVIGMSLGVLFQRDLRGFGSGMGWGLGTASSGGSSGRSPSCRSGSASRSTGRGRAARRSSARSWDTSCTACSPGSCTRRWTGSGSGSSAAPIRSAASRRVAASPSSTP
jgi:hypothetical protein